MKRVAGTMPVAMIMLVFMLIVEVRLGNAETGDIQSFRLIN